MATAYTLRHSNNFLTYSEWESRIELWQDGYLGAESTIEYTKDVHLRHSGGGKDSWDSTFVQGQELQFTWIIHQDDLSTWESEIFESSYKEFKVILYSWNPAVGGLEISFIGYLKQENLTRPFVDNPEYVEVAMSATDALADLKNQSFRGHFGNFLYTERYTLLETIKHVLEHTGLELDFYVQLNTYESTYMTSTQNALKELWANPARFYSDKTDILSGVNCWKVLEYILKPFGCKLKQIKGQYQISKAQEGESPYKVFSWETLTQIASGTTANIKDVSDFNVHQFHQYIEEQKIAPLSLVIVDHQNAIGTEEVTGLDYDDWTDDGPWVFDVFNRSIDPDDSTIVTLHTVHPDEQKYLGELGDSLQLKTSFAVTKTSEQDYLKIKFKYRAINLFTLANTEPRMLIRVKVQRPDGLWYPSDMKQHTVVLPTYPDSGSLPGSLTYSKRKMNEFESNNSETFRIVETGQYNVRIEFIPAFYYPYWASADFQLQYVEIVNESNGEVEEYNPVKETIEMRWEQTGATGFIYKNGDDELYLADGGQVNEIGALLAVSAGAFKPTSTWNGYGGAQNTSIADLYARSLLNNRARYKNYLASTTFLDRNRLITFSNTLLLYKNVSDQRYYTFGDYNWDIIGESITCSLVEILLEEQTFAEIAISQTDTKTYEGVIDPNQPLWHENHGFGIGMPLLWDTDLTDYIVAFAVKDAGVVKPATHVVSEVLNENEFKVATQGVNIEVDLDEPVIGQFYYVDPDDTGTGKPVLLPSELQPDTFLQKIGVLTVDGFEVSIEAPIPADLILSGDEKGIIENLVSHTVVLVFNTPFENQPLESVLKAFRMEKQPDNTYREQEVPFGYVDALQPLTTGFTIKINETFTPDLTGVKVKYKYEKL